jgi:hypothetical protein
VRRYDLKRAARAAFALLTPTEATAVAMTIASMMDEEAPLVGPEDMSVAHGSSIMGRPVPGTGLVLCYVPAGAEFFVVNIVRA